MVEAIRGHRGTGKRTEYQVKWTGYREDDPDGTTWEPESGPMTGLSTVTAVWPRPGTGPATQSSHKLPKEGYNCVLRTANWYVFEVCSQILINKHYSLIN